MEYRYPMRALIPDYLRASAGLALAIGVLWLFKLAPAMVYICSGVGVVFLAFGLRTARRHLTIVEVAEDGIRLRGGMRAVLLWKDLNVMTVTYYSARRDHSQGWMELRLRGMGRTNIGQGGYDNKAGGNNRPTKNEDHRKTDPGRNRLGGRMARRTIRLDSGMDGFSTIVARAARAAINNQIELDSATGENLLAMGIDTAKLAEIASKQ